MASRGATPNREYSMNGAKIMSEEYLTSKEIADRLGIAVGTIHNHRSAGTGPRFYKIFGAVRYRWCDVDAWLKERCFNNAAQAHEALRRGEL